MKNDQHGFDDVQGSLWQNSTEEYNCQVMRPLANKQLINKMEHDPRHQNPTNNRYYLRETIVLQAVIIQVWTRISQNSIQSAGVTGNVVRCVEYDVHQTWRNWCQLREKLSADRFSAVEVDDNFKRAEPRYYKEDCGVNSSEIPPRASSSSVVYFCCNFWTDLMFADEVDTEQSHAVEQRC